MQAQQCHGKADSSISYIVDMKKINDISIHDYKKKRWISTYKMTLGMTQNFSFYVIVLSLIELCGGQIIFGQHTSPIHQQKRNGGEMKL